MRSRHYRVIRVELDCGCITDLETGRFRVNKEIGSMLVGAAMRRGVWCTKHTGSSVPVKPLGVFRQS